MICQYERALSNAGLADKAFKLLLFAVRFVAVLAARLPVASSEPTSKLAHGLAQNGSRPKRTQASPRRLSQSISASPIAPRMVPLAARNAERRAVIAEGRPGRVRSSSAYTSGASAQSGMSAESA